MQFQRVKVATMFHKDYSFNFIIVKFYVDNIIFCTTNKLFCSEFWVNVEQIQNFKFLRSKD